MFFNLKYFLFLFYSAHLHEKNQTVHALKQMNNKFGLIHCYYVSFIHKLQLGLGTFLSLREFFGDPSITSPSGLAAGAKIPQGNSNLLSNPADVPLFSVCACWTGASRVRPPALHQAPTLHPFQLSTEPGDSCFMFQIKTIMSEEAPCVQKYPSTNGLMIHEIAAGIDVTEWYLLIADAPYNKTI